MEEASAGDLSEGARGAATKSADKAHHIAVAQVVRVEQGAARAEPKVRERAEQGKGVAHQTHEGRQQSGRGTWEQHEASSSGNYAVLKCAQTVDCERLWLLGCKVIGKEKERVHGRDKKGRTKTQAMTLIFFKLTIPYFLINLIITK